MESIFLSPDDSEYIITVYQIEGGEITYKSVSRGTFTKATIANVYLSDGTTKLTGYENYLYKDTNADIQYWQSISNGGFGTWKNYKIPASYTFMNNSGNTFEVLMYGYLADDASLTTWYSSQTEFDSHMASGLYTKQ
ncbi:MAG: hypothetical protein R3Y36_06815 [Spirochaetales bacterium]